jgi:DNA-binding MarR family transcriptional regulator
MAVHHGPDGPDIALAVEVDLAAAALLSVWEQAREQAVIRLSAAQLRALLAIEQCPGVNLRGLAAGLGMILSSASRLCDRLVAAGLLEREPGRADRREIALSLSPAGVDLLAELRNDRRRRLADVLADMSEPGRVALLRGLREFGTVVDRSHHDATPIGRPAGRIEDRGIRSARAG